MLGAMTVLGTRNDEEAREGSRAVAQHDAALIPLKTGRFGMNKSSRTRPNHKTGGANTAKQQPTTTPKMVESTVTSSFESTRPAIKPQEPSKLRDGFEWVRGKLELVWETIFIPFFGWLRAMTERLFGSWGGRMRLPAGARRGSGRLADWSWDEQGVRMLKQTLRILVLTAICAAVVVLLSAGTIRLVNAVSNIKSPFTTGSTSSPDATATGVPAITIRNTNGQDGTPPPMPQFTFGMWVSNNTPPLGGPVTIYAKVSQFSKPLPGIGITVSVYGRNITGTTNQDGIAAFTLNTGGKAQVPITAYGSVHLGDADYSATTFFTPI